MEIWGLKYLIVSNLLTNVTYIKTLNPIQNKDLKFTISPLSLLSSKGAVGHKLYTNGQKKKKVLNDPFHA